MNKKTKITIVVIVILLLVLIPIGIYAFKKIYVHFPTDEEIAQANEEEKNRDMKNSPLKEHEKMLYDISIKILEEENLTNEEKELMKDFIKGNMYNIEKDASLLSRAEAVLNK